MVTEFSVTNIMPYLLSTYKTMTFQKYPLYKYSKKVYVSEHPDIIIEHFFLNRS